MTKFFEVQLTGHNMSSVKVRTVLFVHSDLCLHGALSHAGAGLGQQVKEKNVNAITYRDILYNCVCPTL